MPFDVEGELGDLWQVVKAMGNSSEARSFTWDINSGARTNDIQSDRSFETAVCHGMEVSWEDVSIKNGLFSFRNLPVMFSLAGSDQLHLKRCQLLKDIKPNSIGSVQAWYKAELPENDDLPDNGSSEVILRDSSASKEICLHCLYELNYAGFYYGTRQRRELIRDEFAFDRFVADNGASYFSHDRAVAVYDHPEQLIQWYTPGSQLSFNSKESKRSEECAQCTVELELWQLNPTLVFDELLQSEQPRSLSVRKSANSAVSELNTQLCWDCYKKHNHDLGLCLPYELVEAINKQRRQQGLLHERGWQQLKQFSDSAYYGLLDHLQRNIGSAPELFYPIALNTGQEAWLLYAWPETRKAITPLANNLQQYTDWALWDAADTLASFASS